MQNVGGEVKGPALCILHSAFCILHSARPSILALLLIIAGILPAHAGVKITIVNNNAPDIGFNDPTPAAPLGGNNGTTVGQQRLIAFQRAADIWGGLLDSNIEVKIRATFEPLACEENSGTLGSAGTRFIFSDFANAPRAGIWYHAALASKLAGTDLTIEDVPPNGSEMITARFNSKLGEPGCLASSGWYYGLDALGPGNRIDLISVLLHEFAHGLGFSTLVDKETGELFLERHDIYSVHIFDNTAGLNWTEMTNAQRQASIINDGALAWAGENVRREAPGFLGGPGTALEINSPSAIAGRYPVGIASFGPPITAAGLTGNVAQATDPAQAPESPSMTDGCSALSNPSDVRGKIALVDVGGCGFTMKVKNAQNAGAIAVIVVETDPAIKTPLLLGGSDPSITIPAVRVTSIDGGKIKSQLSAGVNVTIRVDAIVRTGTDASGRVKLFAPDPVVGGSSVSHWDVSATPNLLMEPRINSGLGHGVDLTLAHFADLGWLTLATAPPLVTASKSDTLANDRDGDSQADPGDTIRYTVVVRNIGGVASGVHFRDTIDPSTTLAAGSITTTQGTIDSTAPIDVSLGDLGPNGQATIRFDVTVNNNTSSIVTSISNQGRVNGTNFTEITTDDPDTTTAGDSTRTTTNFNAITAQLTASIAIDADGNNLLTRGDTLLYTATVRNLGFAPATDIVFTSTLPAADLTLVSGSATTTMGTATSAAGLVSVNVGTIAAGGSATITYRVLVNSAIPSDRLSVSNQGTVTGGGISPIVTDDPATTALGDPTVSFFAASRRRGVRR